MKLVALLSLGVLTIAANAARIPTVQAESRTPAEATAHALDELANAIAQGKITLTPTPTPTATATAVPATATLTPAPLATDTPEPAHADPPLPVPDLGQAVAAYVRPSPRDPSGTWLELALPQGRWAILYDSTLCAPPTAWTNVWLALDDQSDRPITADRDDGAMCAVAHWSWTSDVPCAAADQGTCAVELDGAYWDAIAQAEPTATETPVPPPISTPTPRPAVPRALAPVVAAEPQVQRVVQTVVVVETVVVTPGAADTTTVRPIATSSSNANATPRSSPTAIVLVAAQPEPTPTAEPQVIARSRALRPDGVSHAWWFVAALGVVAFGAAAAWFTRGRRRYVL